MRIVADNNIPFLKGVLEPYGSVEYLPGKEIVASTIKNADALIVRTRTKCDEKLLKGSRVKFIATATIGFDHIDTNYCRQNGIVWQNAPGCNSGSVMQYITSVLVRLSLNHRFDFANKTIGIVGVGNVGSKVARMASLLGMNVLLNDLPRERREGSENFVSLDEICAKADIITFHVPLIKEGADKTYHLFDEQFLSKVKKDVIIINSSRGEVVSGNVLKRALKENKIKAAVLDVWENEPDIDNELVQLVEIATPHIAGYSVDGKANGTAMSVQALSKFFKLDLDSWFPGQLPSPANSSVEIDCNGLTCRQVINRATLFTYDVQKDDTAFRKSITTFENQRNNYPVRREFNFFTIKLINPLPECAELLRNLGFGVVS